MMKKVLAFAIAILCGATFVQAQEGESTDQKKQSAELAMFGLGARIAVGYGMLWGLVDDWSGDDNDEQPGGIDFDAGVMGRIELTPVFHFTPELLFRYASMTQEDDLGDRKFKQMDIQIPLMLRANASPKFYAYAGPQLGFNINSDVSINATVASKTSNSPKAVSISDDIDQAAFNFGIAAGAGFYPIEKLSIDLRVYLGLTELYPDAKSLMIDLTGAKMISFKVGLAYWIF
jgi:hypothetical protein